MTGVYKWGWGDGPRSVAFWGWSEAYSAAGGFIPVTVMLPWSVKGVRTEGAGKAAWLRNIYSTAHATYPCAASVHQYAGKTVHRTDSTVTSRPGLTVKAAMKASAGKAEVNKRPGKAAAEASGVRSAVRDETGKTVSS